MAADALALYQQCREDGYSFCVTKLPSSVKDSRSDVTVLSSDYWHTSIVGALDDESCQGDWTLPLEWAGHMGMPVVIVPPLPTSSRIKTSSTHIIRGQVDDQMEDADNDVAMENDTIHDTLNPHMELLEYSRKVGQGALKARGINSHLWVPMSLPSDNEEAAFLLQQWSCLNSFTKYPNNIGVLLDMVGDGGPGTASEKWGKLQITFLHHLIGMGAIRGLRFPCNTFMTNNGGFPTLSRGMQYVTSWLLQRLGGRLRFLIDGPPRHFQNVPNPSVIGATGCLPYTQYLQHLRKKLEVRTYLDTEQARLEEDHCDRLQRPLQPLRDHLENNTYEVFEKDPVKYREYQRAISMALMDFGTQRDIVVMVVGAGRGPLVTCVMNAFAHLPPNSRPPRLSVWAVEKNPSAVIYLQSLLHRQYAAWKSVPANVEVIHSDLRKLTTDDLGNRKADLVVSELLGSFGDNELSPECLDALFTQTNVCHDKTISIPTDYTAYLAPASSVKLHQKVQEQALFPNEYEDTEGNGVLGVQIAVETPYVVRPQVASQMTEAKECWKFQHPLGAGTTSGGVGVGRTNDWNRSTVIEFDCDLHSAKYGNSYGDINLKVKEIMELPSSSSGSIPSGNVTNVSPDDDQGQFEYLPWTLTGFFGFFHSVLYTRKPSNSLEEGEQVAISIEPGSFSTGMFSWFPLYFPLAAPLQIPASKDVKVRAYVTRHFDADKKQVWYEWSTIVYNGEDGSILHATPVYNPRGRSYAVGA